MPVLACIRRVPYRERCVTNTPEEQGYIKFPSCRPACLRVAIYRNGTVAAPLLQQQRSDAEAIMATVTDVNSYLNALQPTASSTSSTDLDKDDFLKLFVAQLENQDPLNPMEDQETLAQLAQFSSLEQLANLNTQMASIAEVMKSQSFQNATNYIGKSVLAGGNGIALSGGTATTVTYTLPSDAKQVSANIVDKDGNIIETVSLGEKSSGEYDFTWNGKAYSGSTMADGQYTVEFTATDSEGASVLVSTQVAGKVESVSMENGSVVLELEDGRTIALSDVYTITNTDNAESKAA